MPAGRVFVTARAGRADVAGTGCRPIGAAEPERGAGRLRDPSGPDAPARAPLGTAAASSPLPTGTAGVRSAGRDAGVARRQGRAPRGALIVVPDGRAARRAWMGVTGAVRPRAGPRTTGPAPRRAAPSRTVGDGP